VRTSRLRFECEISDRFMLTLRLGVIGQDPGIRKNLTLCLTSTQHQFFFDDSYESSWCLVSRGCEFAESSLLLISVSVPAGIYGKLKEEVELR